MKYIIFCIALFVTFDVTGQKTIPLYSGNIPNSTSYEMKEVARKMPDGSISGYQKVSRPALDLYIPEKSISTGYAVVICPGGAYIMHTYKGEGTNIAQEFCKQGIAAFVLKYRLPSDSIMPDKSIGPLQDAQQAIKIVRENAAEWNIDPAKIGIMGFSAGGHLASTAATHFNHSYIPNPQNTNLRPDFLILVYSVISMKDSLTHMGSRDCLLGTEPSKEQIALFSNELQVNSNTPRSWLTHTGDDTVVPVGNSIRFYEALIKHKVPAEMHLFPKGNHGFVLRQKPEEWMKPLIDWLKR